MPSVEYKAQHSMGAKSVFKKASPTSRDGKMGINHDG